MVIHSPAKKVKLRSKGEEHVYRCLLNCGILAVSVLHEHQFEGLVGDGGRPLRFDFFINTSPPFLCEFDGRNTHEYAQLIRTFGHRNARRCRMHDEAKHQFAQKRGIPLLRISYRDKNIKATILRFMQKHNVRVEPTQHEDEKHDRQPEPPNISITLMLISLAFGFAYAALRSAS